MLNDIDDVDADCLKYLYPFVVCWLYCLCCDVDDFIVDDMSYCCNGLMYPLSNTKVDNIGMWVDKKILVLLFYDDNN